MVTVKFDPRKGMKRDMLYCPLQPCFDKTWRPGEIVEMK